MGRPSKEAARDTRRDILEAALELFSQHGFYGTSIRQVARAVQLRESALYHHFESKEAILAALTDEFGPGSAMQVFGALDLDSVRKAGAHAALRTLSASLLELWATPREMKFARLMLTEGARLSVDTGLHPAVFIGRVRAFLSAWFEALMEQQLIRRLDPLTAAMGFMGPMLVLRMFHLIFAAKPTELRKVKAEALRQVDLFWESVKP